MFDEHMAHCCSLDERQRLSSSASRFWSNSLTAADSLTAISATTRLVQFCSVPLQRLWCDSVTLIFFFCNNNNNNNTMSAACTSAPVAISSSTTDRCPPCAARCSGVRLALVRALRVTPAWSRTRHISTCPFSAALCSAVLPSWHQHHTRVCYLVSTIIN